MADPKQLEWEFLEHESKIQRLIKMVEREGGNPELINDGSTTAPSKRIISEIAEYEGNKATSGPLVAGKIGMTVLSERCRNFGEWVDGLIKIAN